ncbi:MAG: hypothetical protein QXU98_11695, partial [Candidatus Parvarchaeota archaeon]
MQISISRSKLNYFIDNSTKLLFFFVVALLIGMQIYYIAVSPMSNPFLEPDNYEYYLFAQLVLSSHNISISNPYLVFPTIGFFEHPGLELMPVLLHEAIPSIPLIWDFRLLQALAVIGIYAFTLLLAKRIIDYLGISRAYRYGVYIFTVGSSLLMQYTEVIEWRGTEFITAIQLCIVYLLALYYTDYGKGGRGALREELENMILPATLVLAILSVWIWSGGFVNLLALVVAIPMIWLYRFVIKKHPRVWKYVAAGIALGAVILFFAAAPVENMISGFTAHYGLPSCTANPINIGEIQCLNASNGLMLVLMDLVFGAVAIVLLQDKGLFVSQKSEYEYFIFMILIMALLQLPLAMVYIRALSLIAPYLSLLFGFGVVAMFTEFAKRGSNPLVRAIVFLMIAIA